MTVIPLHYPINYGYYGHPLTHFYGKREAEAEPAADAEAKADPWLAYSGYAGYPYVYGARPAYYSHPLVTKKVVTKAVDGEKKTVLPYVLPYGGLYNYGYGYHGYPVVKTVASHVIAKREQNLRLIELLYTRFTQNSMSIDTLYPVIYM